MILITGATGRVGRELLGRLLAEKKYRGKLRILAHNLFEAQKMYGSKVEIYQGDLSSEHDFIALAEACKNVDLIVHLAGLVDYSASGSEFMAANYHGTLKLIKAAKLQRKPPKFIFLSSTSIYRGAKSEQISEKTKPFPSNAYGRSKLAAEGALRESGLDYLILRSPIIYGKGFKTGIGDVVKLIKKRRMPILGNGNNHIAYIHISDLVDALVSAINSKLKNQEFIFSSGEAKTQNELFEAVAKELHVPSPRIHIPTSVAYLSTSAIRLLYRLLGLKPKIFKEYVHTLAESRVYNISKAKKMLHFRPKIKINDGIKEMILSMQEKG
ncbi:MAG: NAD-dependent epimerase/dehydratase family protein [Candidatus Micrarchaeota archaeon]